MTLATNIVSTLVQAGIRAPRPDLFLAADATEGLGGVELVSIWCWGRPVLRGLPNPVSLTLACTRTR